MAHTRFTLSIPPEVAGDLDALCQLLGASRSTVVTLILEDNLRTLIPAAEFYEDRLPGGNPGRRLIGASGLELRQSYVEVRKLADQIDPGDFELVPLDDGED